MQRRVSGGKNSKCSRAKSGMSFHMGKPEKWLVTLEKKSVQVGAEARGLN